MKTLQDLMRSQGISSFKALSKQSGVSEKSIWRLRKGQLAQMQAGTLVKLANALNISLDTFVATLSELQVGSDSQSSLEASEQPESTEDLASAIRSQPVSMEVNVSESDWKEEYQRLQQVMSQQREQLLQEFQHASLQTLEPWLLQWSAAAYAAQNNPQVPAVNLLPLLRPIDALLQEWGIAAIAQVGEELAFDPQLHQVMEGMADAGDRVRVRYAGYRQGDRVLYRAKVSSL
jgi:molecular chaperone GrpE (heat shock protein)/DNA-binding Xre family transcriptional regulator